MTLAQAIEKVGVGGKVTSRDIYRKPVISKVMCVTEKSAILQRVSDCFEWYAGLHDDFFEPVLPKKRIVLQAWRNMTTGFTVFLGEGETFNSKHGYVRREDIPNMVFEDGKQVFE